MVRRVSKALGWSLALVLLAAMACWAASVTTVSVDSSTAGTTVVTSIGGGVTVTVPSDGAVPVYVARLQGTCSTALTAKRGVRITAGNGYDFIPATDGWSGQLCALLQSGSTAVTIEVNTW